MSSDVGGRAAQVAKDAREHDPIIEKLAGANLSNLVAPTGYSEVDGVAVPDEAKYAGPTHYATFSEDEKRYAMAKRDMTESGAYGAGVLTDVDIAMYLKQMEVAEAAEKDQFILNSIDWNQPGVTEYLNRVCPDFQQRRLDTLNAIADAQGMMTKIEVMGGPQTPEEMNFWFLVSTGRVKVPKEAPHVLAVSGGSLKTQVTDTFEHGLLYHIFYPDEHRLVNADVAFGDRFRRHPTVPLATSRLQDGIGGIGSGLTSLMNRGKGFTQRGRPPNIRAEGAGGA